MIEMNISTIDLSRQVNSLVKTGLTIDATMAESLRKTAQFGYEILRDRLRSPTQKPRYRSGDLFRSFLLRRLQDRIGWHMFSDSRYAAVHELGTQGKGGKLPDIRPKRGRLLAIPLQKAVRENVLGEFDITRSAGALTAAGRIRGEFALTSLRQHKDLFFWKSRTGKMFLALKEENPKKDRPPKLVFRLVPKVSIPARPYLRPTLQAMVTHINFNFPRFLATRLASGK